MQLLHRWLMCPRDIAHCKLTVEMPFFSRFLEKSETQMNTQSTQAIE